jgi:hypothetical protein
MASTILTIIFISIAAILGMSCSDYRWEQLHMQGEEGAEDYIFACWSAA